MSISIAFDLRLVKTQRAGQRWTIQTWLEHWLENIARAGLRTTSFDAYRIAVSKHLIPNVRKHRLDRNPAFPGRIPNVIIEQTHVLVREPPEPATLACKGAVQKVLEVPPASCAHDTSASLGAERKEVPGLLELARGPEVPAIAAPDEPRWMARPIHDLSSGVRRS